MKRHLTKTEALRELQTHREPFKVEYERGVMCPNGSRGHVQRIYSRNSYVLTVWATALKGGAYIETAPERLRNMRERAAHGQ